MAFGNRLRYIRKKQRITQKYLGLRLGFSEKSAESRIAQYENGRREPKTETIEQIADILDVSTLALDCPKINNEEQVMHTLFALEDMYGLSVFFENERVCLKLERCEDYNGIEMQMFLTQWLMKKNELRDGKITQEEYDHWKYNFSDGIRVKTKPSPELNKALTKAFKKSLKD